MFSLNPFSIPPCDKTTGFCSDPFLKQGCGISHFPCTCYEGDHFLASTLRKCPEGGSEGRRKGSGGFELLVLESVYLNRGSTSVVLRPGCTLESPGCPVQLDGHLWGWDLGPGIFHIFPGDSTMRSDGNQGLPEVRERAAAESRLIHLQPGEVTFPFLM